MQKLENDLLIVRKLNLRTFFFLTIHHAAPEFYPRDRSDNLGAEILKNYLHFLNRNLSIASICHRSSFHAFLSC